MADDSQKLRIDIVVGADTAGAKQAADSIEGLTKETNKASEANKEHEKTIAGVNLETGESRRVIAEVNNVLPGLVEGIRAVTSPLGAFAAALTVFDYAKEKIAEYDKQLDEAADRMAERAGDMATAIEDANRRIAASAAEASSALHEIEKGFGAVKTKAEEATAAIKENEQAQIALTDAGEAYELKRVEAARKAGAIDDLTAAKQEADIKHAAELRKNQIQDTAENAVVNQKKAELDNAYLSQHRAQEIVDNLGAGQVNREARLDQKNGIPKQIEGYEKQLADKDAEIKKAKAEFDDREKTFQDQKGLFGNDPDHAPPEITKNRDEAKTKLDDLQGNRDLIAQAIKQDKDEVSRIEGEQKQYDDAKKAVGDFAETIRKVTAEFAALTTKAGEDSNLRSQITSIHDATNRVGFESPAPRGSAASFPPQLQEAVKQYQTDFEAYHQANLNGHKNDAAALLKWKKNLEAELDKIRRDLAGLDTLHAWTAGSLSVGGK